MKLIKTHFQSIYKTLQLICNGRYLIYFLPGIAISLVFFYVMDVLSGWFSFLDMVSYTPWVGDELQTGVGVLTRWFNVVALFIFQFILLTLFSPFNTLLGEKLDTELTGVKHDGGFERIITDIVRMLGIMLIGLVFDLVFYILWNITIANIFNLSAVTPFVMIIVNSFWFGFSFYDFALERNKVSIGGSYKFAWKNFSYLVVTGLIFSALLMIPYVGMIIAPVLLTIITTFNYYKMKQVNSTLTITISDDKSTTTISKNS